MPNSPFSAAARKLARSHFPLTPGDDMPVEMTLGELATFAEESMNQAAGLDALHTASAEAFDRVYHPLFFPALDNRGSANHILDGLRQALISSWYPSREPYRMILNVPDDENRDNLKTHVEEFKSLLTDGVGAIADLIAEVELYAPGTRENARHIRPALLLVAELTRALPMLDRLEELAEGGVPVTDAGAKEAAADG